MILFDSAIMEGLEDGSIIIDPFDRDQLGCNSYDVRLGDQLLIYEMLFGKALDMRVANDTKGFAIPDDGLYLLPGQLYLGSTVETIGTTRTYVPHIEGRSSVGRLGMAVHVTAGFGDVGFVGQWTLEITVVHPLKVYPGERIAQAYFLKGLGSPTRTYSGKYAGMHGPEASRMEKDKR
jgi:dCTP deaminase